MANREKSCTQVFSSPNNCAGRKSQFRGFIPQDSFGSVIDRAEEDIMAAGVEVSEELGEYILTCNVRVSDLERLSLFLDNAGYKYSIARSLKNVPDTEQPLFRFELFYDGVYQAVGLLQGLDDICEPAVYRKLMKPFKDDLPVPIGLDQPCSFWFTEQGLQKFAGVIDEINQCVSQSGWEVRCIVLWIHEMNYLYQDEYQIALGPEFVDRDSFVNFSRAVELMGFDVGTVSPNRMATKHFNKDHDFSD